MKKLIFYLITLLLSSNLYSQLVDNTITNLNDPTIGILKFIYSFERYINSTSPIDEENLFTKEFSKKIEGVKNNSVSNSISYNKIKLKINEHKFIENSYYVYCYIIFYLPNNEIEIVKDTIILVRNNTWKIIDIKNSQTLISKIAFNKTTNLSLTGFKDVETKLSELTFKPKPLYKLYINNYIYVLGYGLTKQYGNNSQLYDANGSIDITKCYNNSQINDITGFSVDPAWRRIIYSREINGTTDAIKSYGDNPGDACKFRRPTAIDVNEFGEIFIADAEANRIIKLQYSTNNNSIIAPTNPDFVQISELLSRPIDVCYYNNLTPFDRSDDFVVVSNSNKNEILIFNPYGLLLNKITHYTIDGLGIIKIQNLGRLIVYPLNYLEPCIAFIDDPTVITGRVNYYSNVLNSLSISPPRFPNTSMIFDIGLDASNNLIVSDKSQGVIHKLSEWGEYICSYNGTKNSPDGFFISPRICSDLVYSYPVSNMGILDFNHFDAWGQNSGLRRFLPGADALDIKVNKYSSYIELSFRPSDLLNYKMQLIDLFNNSIIMEETGYSSSSWVVSSFVSLNILNSLFYKLRIYFRPYYDSQYGEFSVGWKYKEIIFSTLDAPIISGFYQSPNPIPAGETGTVTCNLSQGNGNIYYEWTYYDKPDNVNISFQGNTAIIDNNQSLNIATIKNEITVPPFMLTCTASNILGSSSQSYYPSLSTSPGCPMLAFNSDSLLVDENPLLITSLSNPGIDVTDYYLINKSIQPESGKIKFIVHEPQTEHTYLDQVELYKVKTKRDEFTAITDDGELVTYKRPNKPYKITLNGKTDLTNVLSDLDGNRVELKAGDILLIEKSSPQRDNYEVIGQLREGEEEYVVIGGEKPPLSHKKAAGRIRTYAEPITEKELRLTLNNEFYFRPNMSIICKKLINSGNSVEITINQKLNLDYITIVKNLKTAKVSNLELISSIHSSSGEIKDKLLNQDYDYGEILPSERISFIFNDDNTPVEKSSFILKSGGRYTTIENKTNKTFSKSISQAQMPIENNLFQNSPNPFNPSTKIIYTIKEPGFVTLKIYDLLGREIATLVNELKPTGEYEIEFNSYKYGLSSGVYFYQLISGSFTSTKKFILMK